MGRRKVEVLGHTKEDQSAEKKSKRLRELALTCGLLSKRKAVPNAPLHPHSGIVRCDEKDICIKGHRKNKYLFSFPGLVAPVAGGKFGDLTQLDTKHPILYVDFLQGRLKLFGTIVYSKNKYITLNFVRGAGSIQCEDIFENLVVFSEAWWIGTKEENPDELRLEMPSEPHQERHSVYDFAGGAGRSRNLKDVDVHGALPELAQVSEFESSKQCTPKGQLKMDRWLFQKKPSEKKSPEKSSDGDAKTNPKKASEWELDEDDEAFVKLGDASTPSRQSARTHGKKHSYAESSSEENQTDGSNEDGRAHAERMDPQRKNNNNLFDDAENGFLVSESQISQMELAVSSQISAPKISASGKILSTSVQADSSPNTVGAGSKQLSLSGFFMKSNEEKKSANVEPCVSLMKIGSTDAYEKTKTVKSTLCNDDAGKKDEDITSKDEMELVLPCTPSGMNGSKRKRKATPDEKKTPKGTGGKGKPLAKSGKKIIENTISKVQSLILVQY